MDSAIHLLTKWDQEADLSVYTYPFCKLPFKDFFTFKRTPPTETFVETININVTLP